MPVLVALAVAAAGFVKGSIGFGFPTLGTPLLALVVDVKTAIVLLIVPNIAMDTVQLVRTRASRVIVRRIWPVVALGGAGMVIGTRLLAFLAPRTVALVLGGFLLVFVALNATRLSPRLPPRWEPWASPLAGLIVGVIGGITSAPGTPLALYFYALGLTKREFVGAVAFSFILYKAVQLGAVAWFGLMTLPLLGWSIVLTAAAFAGFGLGLRVQDRLPPAAFNRAVLAFLGAIGVWLVARNL